jgi:hypothetical protein
MTATERGLPASVTDNPLGPGCTDGRLLALRCLGIPQVITRAPVSRRRALARRLAAFCARIRPRNTAELASLALYMGEEIDRRERMLDAALRATAEVPCEPAKGAHSERVARGVPIAAGTQSGDRTGISRLAAAPCRFGAA